MTRYVGQAAVPRKYSLCMKPHYREVFNITRLDEAIKIYPNESEAIAVENVTLIGEKSNG